MILGYGGQGKPRPYGLGDRAGGKRSPGYEDALRASARRAAWVTFEEWFPGMADRASPIPTGRAAGPGELPGLRAL